MIGQAHETFSAQEHRETSEGVVVVPTFVG